MNCHYLIDYENVRELGLQGLHDLPESDTVHIFYSQNAGTMSLPSFLKLAQNQIRAALRLYLVEKGKQSADMQLVSFLGYLIGTEGLKSRYVIISRDSDFQNTPAFWESRFRDITVIIGATIQQANERIGKAVSERELAPGAEAEKKKPKEKKPKEEKPKEEKPKEKTVRTRKETAADRSRLNNQIQAILSGKKVEGAKISNVASIAVKHFQAGNRKKTIQELLVKRYGKKEGDALYQWIASCL